MKGYSYPGTSPLKGKKEDAALAKQAQETKASTDEATALIKSMPFGAVEESSGGSNAES